MLNWYDQLYVGDNVKKKFEKVKKKLDQGKIVPGIFLITLASNDVDQLDIINSFYLLQETVYRRCPMIVGIAKGQEEATELVIEMTNEAFLKNGNGNIKDYLLRG